MSIPRYHCELVMLGHADPEKIFSSHSEHSIFYDNAACTSKVYILYPKHDVLFQPAHKVPFKKG